jgi:hypothetical protein
MAKRKVAVRGRAIVALLLLGFVLIATGVIWRREIGIRQNAEREDLLRQLQTLESTKLELESQIRIVTSFPRLAPLVEQRMGMRIASDSQNVILRRQIPNERP